MQIGLYLTHTNTKTHTVGVSGEEIWAQALCKGLNAIEGVTARCYGLNMGFMPETDIAIYMHKEFFGNDIKLYGREKNVAVMQNYEKTEEFQQKLLEKYLSFKGNKIFTTSTYYSNKYKWQLLYPCVDFEEFKSVKPVDKYKHDILYIGNNIKNIDKTNRFLRVPNINYGIYGNGFNKPLSHYESLKAFSSATLNLNYGFDTMKDIITARIFQIASCKALVITEWTESYERIFKDSMFYIKPNDVIDVKYRECLEIAKSEVGRGMKMKAHAIVEESYNCIAQARILFDSIME